MKSEYLKRLSVKLEEYRFVLIYGAGGVAKNLLILLGPYIDKKRIVIVVSRTKDDKKMLAGYPVKQIDYFKDVGDQALVILSVMQGLAVEMEKYSRKLGFKNYMTAEEIATQLYDEIWRTEISKNKIVLDSIF